MNDGDTTYCIMWSHIIHMWKNIMQTLPNTNQFQLRYNYSSGSSKIFILSLSIYLSILYLLSMHMIHINHSFNTESVEDI